jgi:hypothetical protein
VTCAEDLFRKGGTRRHVSPSWSVFVAPTAWALRALGTGNPQSPGVIPVSSGIKTRRLSAVWGYAIFTSRTVPGVRLCWGTGEREILYAEPVRRAIPKDARAVPSARGGRSQPRHQIDRRSARFIRILSGGRRSLAILLYSRPPYSTFPSRPSWPASRCLWRLFCRRNMRHSPARSTRHGRRWHKSGIVVNRLRLRINDAGCGRDEATLRKAPSPFFPAQPAGRRRGHGSGLRQPPDPAQPGPPRQRKPSRPRDHSHDYPALPPGG